MGRKGPELSEDRREIVVYEVTAKIMPLGIISANLNVIWANISPSLSLNPPSRVHLLSIRI